MGSLFTKLHIKDGVSEPRDDGYSNNHYCFVEFNLSQVQSLVPESNLLAYLDKRTPMAATRAGIVALDNYDDFMNIIKPELERLGFSVQDPHDNIASFNYVKDILSRPGYRRLEDYGERIGSLAPKAPKRSIDCFIHTRAGKPVESDETVYVLKADSNYHLVQYAHSQAVAHHDSSGSLMLTMTKEQFDQVKGRIQENFKLNGTLKKYFGDKSETFFGIDKVNLVELVTPSHTDDLKIVVNRIKDEATLLRSVLVSGKENASGERTVMKAACINHNGQERVISFAQANVIYRKASDAEKASYKNTTDFGKHPFHHKSDGILDIRNVATQEPALSKSELTSPQLVATRSIAPSNS